MDRQNNRKGGAFAKFTFNAQTAAVTVDDVLDDRKTKTGAAKRSTAMVIGAVETLGQGSIRNSVYEGWPMRVSRVIC